MDDELLESRFIERLRARDERAFNDLVRLYERRVFSLLFRLIGRRDEAEDLAQEVFVQVFKAIGGFRGESKLSTWLFRIAVNLSKNRSKYLARRRTDSRDDLDGTSDDDHALVNAGRTSSAIDRPDDLVSGMQLEVIVERAIAGLEPDFREVLLLRDVEDMTYDEIAEITGLADGTVKSRIHRARLQLREAVERATERNYDDRGRRRKSASPPREEEETEQAAVRSILRRARIPRVYDVDLLSGVQARIRQRSRGRFYGDGWSRSRASTATYVVTSILMLTILLLVYLVLLPGVRLP